MDFFDLLHPETITQLPDVTRIEIVDAEGRAFVGNYPAGVVTAVQDDGMTLKVFAGKRQTRRKR